MTTALENVTKTETSDEEQQQVHLHVVPKAEEEHVELVPPAMLKAHPKNQSIYCDEPDEDLIEDIRKRGILEPLVVERGTDWVISGRRRHKAANKLGIEWVPVIYRQYGSERETVEAIVMHNAYRRKTDRQIMMEIEAIWDEEAEKGRLRRVEGGKSSAPGRPAEKSEEGVAKKHSTVHTVGKVIGQSPTKVGRAASLINTAKKELGDQWMEDPYVKEVFDGKTTINSAALRMQKKNREQKLKDKAASIVDVEHDIRCSDNITDIEDGSVDHVICEPDVENPSWYGNYVEEADGEILDIFEGWNSDLHLTDLSGWAHEWSRVIKVGGNIAVLTDERYHSFVREALQSVGFDNLQTVVWHWTNPDTNQRQSMFINSCMYVVTGTFGTDARNAFKWIGPQQMSNHVEGKLPKGRKALKHLGQKPEYLIKWLLERMTNPGDTILDNFAGTGTTGLACRSLKRNFILVEREEDRVEIIKARLAD